MLLAECVGSAALSEVCCLCMLLVIIMPPPLIGRGIIMMAMILSDVCLSVAYIGPKSRTERPRKTKIGSEVAHVTRDSDTTFKVKRSTSPGRFTHCGVNASASCSGECWNVLTVGTYCYVAGGARRFSAHGRRRVAGAYCGDHPPTACNYHYYSYLFGVFPLFLLATGRASST